MAHVGSSIRVSPLLKWRDLLALALAKAAVAGRLNGDCLVDTNFEIDKDASLSIITLKDEVGLDILRHSCAHLIAQSCQVIIS